MMFKKLAPLKPVSFRKGVILAYLIFTWTTHGCFGSVPSSLLMASHAVTVSRVLERLNVFPFPDAFLARLLRHHIITAAI